jgi:hypothetical protein
MPVLWITVILSLLLALVFLVLFIKEHGRFHFGSAERASLLPLEEDAPRPAPRADARPPVDSLLSPDTTDSSASRPAPHDR